MTVTRPPKLDAKHWMILFWLEADETLAADEGWMLIDGDGAWLVVQRPGTRAHPWATLMRGETLTHDKARNFLRDYSFPEFQAMLRYTRS